MPIAVFVKTLLCRLGCLPSAHEVVLPLANDRRLPSDTLFLVFEADYRFYPQGEDPDASDTYGDRLGALQEKENGHALQTKSGSLRVSLPPARLRLERTAQTRGAHKRAKRWWQPCTSPLSAVPRTVTTSTMASAQTSPTCCAWPRAAIGSKWGTSSGSDGVLIVMAYTRRGRRKDLTD